MYESPAGHAVRVSLERIVRTNAAPDDAGLRELKTRVCSTVDELRGLGWPIEGIIVRLKTVANEVGFAPRGDRFGRDRDRLMTDIVRWCVERYYPDDGSSEPGPRP